YYLNDELTNRERQRAQAVKDLEATLEQLKAQHAELLASRELTAQLSTPLMRAGRGVLMLPLLGTLDEERTQLIVSSVLSAIKEERAQTIILDLTGVDSVDVRTAQFLSRMVGAAGLLGTKTVLAGISPQVAQAMVQINIDTRKLITVRDLADALRYVGLT
ncbi:MAG TPA: STAS domain-containing protein, partial [Pseudomonadota bacterium]|nr:STAS domain-containing protein [Pseudomonadota bacterium]